MTLLPANPQKTREPALWDNSNRSHQCPFDAADRSSRVAAEPEDQAQAGAADRNGMALRRETHRRLSGPGAQGLAACSSPA